MHVWLTCVPHGRDEEGARATVTPCRLRRMCKHARMHTCMHGDHVGAVRGICQRVSITSLLLPHPRNPAPSNRASLTSRYFLAEGNIPAAFYGREE